MKKGSVSAGIVTYNNASEIVPCLNSLIECTKDMDVDIYVFDNCSQDETVPVIRQYFPRVHVIESRENLGFGRGHNEILKKISSEFHMVVNPDIQFTPKAVQKLTAFLVHYPQVGIITPKIKNVDGSEQLLPKRDPKFSYVVLSKFRPLQFFRDEYTRAGESFNKPTRILSSTGCFFMIRTSVFRRAGGFDERFFMYFEDADLSRRVRKNSSIVFYPNAYVYHAWKRDNTRSLRGIKIFLISMVKYFWKWKRV